MEKLYIVVAPNDEWDIGLTEEEAANFVMNYSLDEIYKTSESNDSSEKIFNNLEAIDRLKSMAAYSLHIITGSDKLDKEYMAMIRRSGFKISEDIFTSLVFKSKKDLEEKLKSNSDFSYTFETVDGFSYAFETADIDDTMDDLLYHFESKFDDERDTRSAESCMKTLENLTRLTALAVLRETEDWDEEDIEIFLALVSDMENSK